MLKQQVISRLLNGETPTIIAESSEAKYASILRWKRELEAAQEAGTVAELIDMDEVAFDAVLQTIREGTPEGTLDDSLETVAAAKHAAATLQQDMQLTASKINSRIRMMSMSADSISELSMLTDALCALQGAFFNKNTTLVQVQNNYDSSDRAYSNFLGDEPRVINQPE